MDLLYKKFTFMANDNLSEKLLFQPQAIRSDEWMVFTPMAIGQYNHNPQFPVINKNLGVAGQNMLVVMGLIPINHITSIAKPITWGFYFFDLKRALAWQWWFPLFGALISLWWLLSILIPGRIFLAFTLSLLYCISPFSIAWSGWSQYIVFLPTIALASFLSILYKKNFQYEKLLLSLIHI